MKRILTICLLLPFTLEAGLSHSKDACYEPERDVRIIVEILKEITSADSPNVQPTYESLAIYSRISNDTQDTNQELRCDCADKSYAITFMSETIERSNNEARIQFSFKSPGHTRDRYRELTVQFGSPYTETFDAQNGIVIRSSASKNVQRSE